MVFTGKSLSAARPTNERSTGFFFILRGAKNHVGFREPIDDNLDTTVRLRRHLRNSRSTGGGCGVQLIEKYVKITSVFRFEYEPSDRRD
jgi:hypothetical protein